MEEITIKSPEDVREVVAVEETPKKRKRKKYDYNENSKAATLKYRKANIKRVNLDYVNSEWENKIYPAIQGSGEPVATFIKTAILQRIEREGL